MRKVYVKICAAARAILWEDGTPCWFVYLSSQPFNFSIAAAELGAPGRSPGVLSVVVFAPVITTYQLFLVADE